MAGQKYFCKQDGTDCTLEIFRVCMKFCDPYERACATNNPGTCGYRKTILSQRNKRTVHSV